MADQNRLCHVGVEMMSHPRYQDLVASQYQVLGRPISRPQGEAPPSGQHSNRAARLGRR
jgi:hypothetical protein